MYGSEEGRIIKKILAEVKLCEQTLVDSELSFTTLNSARVRRSSAVIIATAHKNRRAMYSETPAVVSGMSRPERRSLSP